MIDEILRDSYKLGTGVYFATVNHTSFFVFTGDKIVTLASGGGGDDDAEAAKIPFGHYYLLFLALAIIGLVMYFIKNNYF